MSESPQFLLPHGAKKKRSGIQYETVIHIDNTKGGEDLVNLSIYYVEYGTNKTKFRQIFSRVKVGKSDEITLPAGTHPAGFFLLWKGGDFFRWFGDPVVKGGIVTEIDANWRVDVLDGIKVWGGGFSSSEVRP